MKIALLGLLAHPGEPADGGVQKVCETILRQLEDADPHLRVHALTLALGQKTERRIRRGNVVYHFLPCRKHGRTTFFFAREIRLLRCRVRQLRVDLVHGQPWAEYMLAAVGCGLPHVLTIHGLPKQETSPRPISAGKWVRGRVRELVQRRALRRAANVICISPYIEAYLRARTQGRIWHIPNPIDNEFFDLPPANRNGLHLLCVGRVSARKNQQLLIRTCAYLAQRGVDFACRIVGPIDQRVITPLRRGIEQAQLSGRVELTGPVSKEELLEFYSWANAVVLPSLAETAPLSLMQAMACGRCAFGAAAAGIPALLHHGHFGTLFSPYDPGDLEAKLIHFRQSPVSYWRTAAIAQMHASTEFKAVTIAARTRALYEKILGVKQAAQRVRGSL